MTNFVQANTAKKLMKSPKAAGELDDRTSIAEDEALLSSMIGSNTKTKKDD